MLKKYAKAFFEHTSEELRHRKGDPELVKDEKCLVATEFSDINGKWLNMYVSLESGEKGSFPTITITSSLKPCDDPNETQIVLIDANYFAANHDLNDADWIAAARFLYDNYEAWNKGFRAIWFNSLSPEEQEEKFFAFSTFGYKTNKFTEFVRSHCNIVSLQS